jgi:hypothetical protein
MVYKRKNINKNDSLIIDEERKSNEIIEENNEKQEIIPELIDNNYGINKMDHDDNLQCTEKKALEENLPHQNTIFNCVFTFMNSLLNILFNFIKSILNIIYKLIKSFLKISCMYFVWIIMHYFASHLYTKLCVPNNFYGFLVSPFLTSTPHCQGLRWIVYNAANTINTMWILIGTWLCSKIMFYSPNENINSNTNTPNVNEGFNNMNFYYGGTGI